VRSPIRARISRASVLETRGLHALPREKAVDGLAVYAQHPPDAYRVQPAVVNETTDGLWMNTELVRHIADADEVRLSVR
jgi:hypothetical protein